MDSKPVKRSSSNALRIRPFTTQSFKDIRGRIKAETEESLTRLVEKERQERNRKRGRYREPRPNPTLAQGRQLPASCSFPKDLYGQAIEDFDKFYNNKYTFVVVSRNRLIYRLSCRKSFFLFRPTNLIRRRAIQISTHPYFIWIMMIIILINSSLIAIEYYTLDWLFLVFYTAEIMLRMLARGVFVDEFSYVRDPWLCFDLVVATLGWTFQVLQFFISPFPSVRGFQVFRIFKMIVFIPGFRVIVFAFWKAVCNLRDIGILTFFILSIFALLGLQMFQGSLRLRCVPQDIVQERSITNISTADFFEQFDVDKWVICRDRSGCVADQDCVYVGRNPDGGYTNFDNFGNSLLCVFRIMTQDHWEKLYMQVLHANGTLSVFYFLGVMFLGSYFLLNLLLGIVTMAFEESQNQENLESEAQEQERKGKREGEDEETTDGENSSVQSLSALADYKVQQQRTDETKPKGRIKNGLDIIRPYLMKYLSCQQCPPCWRKFSGAIEVFITDPFVELALAICIALNTIIMALETDDMDKALAETLLVWDKVFAGVFIAEAILKILGLGCQRYLADRWNRFDAVVVSFCIADFLFESLRSLSIIRSLRLLRVIKLAKSWKTLQRLLLILRHTFRSLANLSIVLAMVIFIFASVGGQLFGTCHDDCHQEKARWHFGDFLHSVLMVFRILCGEWVEPMWQCLVCVHCYDYLCLAFFLVVVIIGNLLGLNLFMALLLNAFNAEALSGSQEEDVDPTNLQLAFDRIHRSKRFITVHSKRLIKTLCCRSHANPAATTAVATVGTASKSPRQGCSEGPNREIPQSPKWLQEPQSPAELVPLKARGSSRGISDVANRARNDSEPSRQTNVVAKYGKDSRATGIREVDLSNGQELGIRDTGTRDTGIRVVKISGGKVSKAISPIYSPSVNNNQGQGTNPTCSKDFGHMAVDSSKYSTDEPTKIRALWLLGSSGQAVSAVQVLPQRRSKADTVHIIIGSVPDDCLPKRVVRGCCCGLCLGDRGRGTRWWMLRCYVLQLVEHPLFQGFVVILIVVSSLLLTIEDVHLPERPQLSSILECSDVIFAVLFVMEMILMWLAYGFVAYFRSGWCWLDFLVVMISCQQALWTDSSDSYEYLKALRTLRALRPLRVVSKWKGMKLVVNALFQAIPSILNVLLVCLLFWLIFAIAGVLLFAGKFGWCDDPPSGVDGLPGTSKVETTNATTPIGCAWKGYEVNFDSVPEAYLALFQVATFEGWIEVMQHAADSTEPPHSRPKTENSMLSFLYFICFIILGSCLILNLFVGVLIDSVNEQKKKAEGTLEILMTDAQKKFYKAMKRFAARKPPKPVPKPTLDFQLFFYRLVKNKAFDVAVVTLILVSTSTMVLECHDQSERMSDLLKIFDLVFVVVFLLEFLLKVLGLRWYYFRDLWNLFDFLIVAGSVVEIVAQIYMKDIDTFSPRLLRAFRMFRITRMLRLIKAAKRLRTFLFSLVLSLPALFNIGLLLFLVMFIYAIVGMFLFMHSNHSPTGNGIDDVLNFQTFKGSMLVLLRAATAAGWDEILADLRDGQRTCDPTMRGCGHDVLATPYLVSYLVVTFLVIVNLYIAVVLEYFGQASTDLQLTNDDLDMFYDTWERYDDVGNQYIPASQLSDFVDRLEDPMRLAAPNHARLASLDIPIYKGDLVYCADVLEALTKYCLGTTASEADELGDLKKPKRTSCERESSTLRRQRESYSAAVIQKAWRKQRSESADKDSERGHEGDKVPRLLTTLAEIRSTSIAP